MTTYVTTTPIRDQYAAFEVHQCDIPGCWCFTSASGHPYHGKHKAMRVKARAMKDAAKCAEVT